MGLGGIGAVLLPRRAPAASEKRTFDTVLAMRADYLRQARIVLARLARIAELQPGARVVDVGAAQGMFVLSCVELGYDAVGVEPFGPARELAERLSRLEGRAVPIVAGTAEALPFEGESVDVLHARSVIEHVVDADRAFAEAYRVLKPGGVFFFGTASSMCPLQNEIRGFPGFGWYPDRLKLAIMRWCAEHRPDLVGHGIPATHWFTPWKARRMLRKAGFSKVYDRWDLRLPAEGGRAYAILLKAIKRLPGGKFVADVVVPGCSYAAVR